LIDVNEDLAEEAKCFWMMAVVTSHLSDIATEDWLVLFRVKVQGCRVTMVYGDGNGHELAR
jgi:hypothetical protein